MSYLTVPAPQPDMRTFFRDCPWLQIPVQRQGLIIEHCVQPRPRLLGGGPKNGKMSKLAALAAKRRQQEASKSSGRGSDQLGSADDYAETLNKLRISQKSNGTSISSQSSALNEEESKADGSGPATDQVSPNEEVVLGQPQSELQTQQDLRAGPSAFASLLAGSPGNPAARQLRLIVSTRFGSEGVQLFRAQSRR